MQRRETGVLRDGSIYNPQFEVASGGNNVIKKGATLTDTLDLLPDYVPQYAFQADKITGALRDIKGDVLKTCENIWVFLHDYIGYKPDEKGKEQIRSVRRLWQDKIGDCDCYAFFISCILYTLHISHTFRVSKYSAKGGFQHIYVAVPHKGKEIIIDACLDSFNEEAPNIIEKIDVKMDLEFLNGFDSEEIARNGGSVDAQDLMGGSLGSFKTFIKKTGDKIKTAGAKVTTAIKKGVHAINTVNPATVALRMGILAGMRLNMFGIAGNLRYAYLSDAEAQKRNLNMKRFERYKKVRAKLEKIFFGAGGKPENLKEAILTGKGNENKEVALSGFEVSGTSYGENSTLREIIGAEMYADEHNAEVDGLGVVVTATVVAAASGILAAIAGIIKNIGDIKQGGEPGADPALDTAEDVPSTEDSSGEENTADTTDDESTTSNEKSSEKGTDPSGTTPPPDNPKPDGEGKDWKAWLKDFYSKNKVAVWAVGGTVVAVGAVLLVRHFTGKKDEKKIKHEKKNENVDGAPRKKGKNKYAGSETLRKLRMSPLR